MRYRFTPVFASVVVGASLLASACATDPAAPALHGHRECNYQALDRSSKPEGRAQAVSSYGSEADIPADAVIVTDPQLFNRIIVPSLVGARTAMSTVQVSARIVNCADHSLAVRGRTSFLNADMAPAEKATAWSVLTIPAGATGTYEAASYSADVAYYFIEIAPE